MKSIKTVPSILFGILLCMSNHTYSMDHEPLATDTQSPLKRTFKQFVGDNLFENNNLSRKGTFYQKVFANDTSYQEYQATKRARTQIATQPNTESLRIKTQDPQPTEQPRSRGLSIGRNTKDPITNTVTQESFLHPQKNSAPATKAAAEISSEPKILRADTKRQNIDSQTPRNKSTNISSLPRKSTVQATLPVRTQAITQQDFLPQNFPAQDVSVVNTQENNEELSIRPTLRVADYNSTELQNNTALQTEPEIVTPEQQSTALQGRNHDISKKESINTNTIEGIEIFEQLGLNADSTQEQIKRMYRKLALQYHPDTGGSTQAFQKIQIAYDFINDNLNNLKQNSSTIAIKDSPLLAQILDRPAAEIAPIDRTLQQSAQVVSEAQKQQENRRLLLKRTQDTDQLKEIQNSMDEEQKQIEDMYRAMSDKSDNAVENNRDFMLKIKNYDALQSQKDNLLGSLKNVGTLVAPDFKPYQAEVSQEGFIQEAMQALKQANPKDQELFEDQMRALAQKNNNDSSQSSLDNDKSDQIRKGLIVGYREMIYPEILKSMINDPFNYQAKFNALKKQLSSKTNISPITEKIEEGILYSLCPATKDLSSSQKAAIFEKLNNHEPLNNLLQEHQENDQKNYNDNTNSKINALNKELEEHIKSSNEINQRAQAILDEKLTQTPTKTTFSTATLPQQSIKSTADYAQEIADIEAEFNNARTQSRARRAEELEFENLFGIHQKPSSKQNLTAEQIANINKIQDEPKKLKQKAQADAEDDRQRAQQEAKKIKQQKRANIKERILDEAQKRIDIKELDKKKAYDEFLKGLNERNNERQIVQKKILEQIMQRRAQADANMHSKLEQKTRTDITSEQTKQFNKLNEAFKNEHAQMLATPQSLTVLDQPTLPSKEQSPTVVTNNELQPNINNQEKSPIDSVNQNPEVATALKSPTKKQKPVQEAPSLTPEELDILEKRSNLLEQIRTTEQALRDAKSEKEKESFNQTLKQQNKEKNSLREKAGTLTSPNFTPYKAPQEFQDLTENIEKTSAKIKTLKESQEEFEALKQSEKIRDQLTHKKEYEEKDYGFTAQKKILSQQLEDLRGEQQTLYQAIANDIQKYHPFDYQARFNALRTNKDGSMKKLTPTTKIDLVEKIIPDVNSLIFSQKSNLAKLFYPKIEPTK